MCGIEIIAGFKGKTFSFSDVDIIKKSKDLIHRGPDNNSTWTSKNLDVVGKFYRLSINDLTNKSNQPFQSEKYNVTLFFNGEIYNFEELREMLRNENILFTTNSDTEVVLQAYLKWGNKCFKKFKGQFAIVIIDQDKKKLIVARDRLGEKPLFYARNNSIFFICSEIKCLIKYSFKKINKQALNDFLRNGMLNFNQSILRGVKSVNPGTFIIINLLNGKIKEETFWNINKNDRKLMSKSKFNHEILKKLLNEVVKSEIPKDVNSANFLSGGIDSSIIAVLTSKYKSKVNSFTAVFPEKFNKQDVLSARLISKYIDSNHNEIEIVKPDVSVLDYISKNFDSPIFDSSILPTYLLSKAISKNFKVVLGGDGADELFGGYKHYSKLIRLHYITRIVPRKLGSKVVTNLLNQMDISNKLYFGLNLTKALFESNGSIENRFFSEKILNEILGLNYESKSKINDYKLNKFKIENFLNYDLQNYLKEIILIKTDRFSMLNSLEVRSPFLHPSIVEFSLQCLHHNQKVGFLNRKKILKRIGYDILPANFDYTNKTGFTPPIVEWCSSRDWLDYMQQCLMHDAQDIFDKKVVSKLFEMAEKKGAIYERLLSLTFFSNWCLKNNIGI